MGAAKPTTADKPSAAAATKRAPNRRIRSTLTNRPKPVVDPQVVRALDAIDAWPVTAAAAGVVARDGQTATRGPSDRPFALASVTKPLVALAALVAGAEG